MSKMAMVIIDQDAAKQAIKRRGFTYKEISNELSYGSEVSLVTALKRGKMPEAKFNRLVKMLHVPAESLLPKQNEKPVQESLKLDAVTLADVLAQLKELNEAAAVIVNLLKGKGNGSDL